MTESSSCQANFVQSQVEREIDLHDQFKQFYNREFEDTNFMESACHSIEDKNALKIMLSSFKQINGIYEIALPWKTDTFEFLFNRAVAESRLTYLRKKLIKDENLFSSISTRQMNTCRLDMPREHQTWKELAPRTWYVPHRANQFKVNFVLFLIMLVNLVKYH